MTVLIIFADTCQKLVHVVCTVLAKELYSMFVCVILRNLFVTVLIIFADIRQKLVHAVANSSSKTHSYRHLSIFAQFLQTLFVTVIMNFQRFLHIVSKNALMNFYASRENGHDCPKIE